MDRDLAKRLREVYATHPLCVEAANALAEAQAEIERLTKDVEVVMEAGSEEADSGKAGVRITRDAEIKERDEEIARLKRAVVEKSAKITKMTLSGSITEQGLLSAEAEIERLRAKNLFLGDANMQLLDERKAAEAEIERLKGDASFTGHDPEKAER